MRYKKQIWLITVTLISSIVAYQQGLAGGNDESTRQALPQTQTSSKKKVNSSYAEYNNALRLMWTKVYRNQGTTLYCDTPFSTKSRKARAKADVNAEHIFPMSWVTKDLQCGTRKQCQANSATFRTIESDLHNIYPARRTVNKARSNYRFGKVSGEKRIFGQCDFEVNKQKRVAEPAPQKRGEIARAMLYLAYQYDLSLHKKTDKLMREWDRQDPPNTEEKRREKIIRHEQGRENPFITRYPFTGD